MEFLDEVSLAAKLYRHKQDKHKVYGMLFAEAIYNIWIQRNKKIFEGACQDPKTVVNTMIFNVACRCS